MVCRTDDDTAPEKDIFIDKYIEPDQVPMWLSLVNNYTILIIYSNRTTTDSLTFFDGTLLFNKYLKPLLDL